MRLLVLDEAPEVIGGVDTYRRAFLPAVATVAEKVVFACSMERLQRMAEKITAPGVEMVDLQPPTRSWRGLIWAIARRLPARLAPGRGRWQKWLSHSHLRAVCRRERLTHVLEICVNHQPFPQLGLPTAGVVHDLSFFTRDDPAVVAAVTSWLNNAVRIFCDSVKTRDDLLALDAQAAARLEVLPLSSPPVQKPATGPNPYARPEPVLYYPARTTWHKGHDLLLAALVQLKAAGVAFHCYLSGHGTDKIFDDQPSPERDTDDVRKACRKYREELAGCVTLLGAKPWPVVEQLYQTANVVVLPTRFEGFGLPLSEALRRDKPVIAARIGPLEEQVAFYDASEQVCWVPPDNVEALAAALDNFLAKRRQFPTFSPVLRERLAAWTWEAVAKRAVTSLAAASSTVA